MGWNLHQMAHRSLNWSWKIWDISYEYESYSESHWADEAKNAE
jgi:hypothetical protein